MRGQRGETRRQELVQRLRADGQAVLGSELADEFGVSRQVLVQDVAILRATGLDIIATPRGYLLRDTGSAAHADVLHVRHGRDAIVDEMTILVDLGIRILDVRVDHPIYGPLRGELCITSRHDIREYMERMSATGAGPLLELTDGRHSHAVDAPRPDLLDRAREELRQRGYLVGR
jgi:transcriptional regulator of NAD metabolism